MTSGTGDNEAAIRTQCWDKAVHAYATSYIFQRRARVLKRKLQLVTYFGLVVPIVIGLLVLGYGKFKELALVISIGTAIGIVQAAISLWSIVGEWVDQYSYAASSASANEALATNFRDLGKDLPATVDELRTLYGKLQVADEAQRGKDVQQGIKGAEERMGMRAALRNFQRQCAGCKKVPTTMKPPKKPTKCGVCGDFRYRTP